MDKRYPFFFQERERDHFSQFITEGFTSYCKRKRRDKVCNLVILQFIDKTLYVICINSNSKIRTFWTCFLIEYIYSFVCPEKTAVQSIIKMQVHFVDM